MAHQVAWNKHIVEAFVKYGMLSNDEAFIVETRAKGWTVSKQAQYLNMSESAVHSKIALLKKKYDIVQKNVPDLLPPRKFSAKETYMDTH